MICQRFTWIAVAGAGLALALAACSPEEEAEKILVGDAKIETAADAERLVGYTAITGRLTVKRAAVKQLVLPRLGSIGGKLYVQKNAELRSLRLPALESVGSEEGDVALIERNPVLAEIDLGALKTAAYQIAVRNNAALRSLKLGALAEIVGPGLDVADNPALQELSLPGLIVAASVAVTGCADLRRVDISDLPGVGALVVERNARLEILDAGGLERLVVLPDAAAAACRLSIAGNGALAGLEGLRNLTVAGPKCAVEVRDNAALPTCAAGALLERLRSAGFRGEGLACGNKPDACGGDGCVAAQGRPEAAP
jgi:hypothetical protein